MVLVIRVPRKLCSPTAAHTRCTMNTQGNVCCRIGCRRPKNLQKSVLLVPYRPLALWRRLKPSTGSAATHLANCLPLSVPASLHVSKRWKSSCWRIAALAIVSSLGSTALQRERIESRGLLSVSAAARTRTGLQTSRGSDVITSAQRAPADARSRDAAQPQDAAAARRTRICII